MKCKGGIVGFQDASIFGEAGSQNTGKSPPEGDAGANPPCPQCGSKKLWRDGHRLSIFGDDIQRWLCRNCGLRFSDPGDIQTSWGNIEKITRNSENALKSEAAIIFSRQIRVKETKNLEHLEHIISKTVPGKRITEDAKGLLIQFEARMLLENYAQETIRGAVSCLKALLVRNADLWNPESVKKALAEEELKKQQGEKAWGQNRKRNVIAAYTLFLNFHDQTWKKPKCKVDEKKPFIPTEEELDALIAGSRARPAAFMQLLKETAFRSGEASRLEWIDIDKERQIITLNKPEKNSNARMVKVSQKLIEMLLNLPKKSTRIFNCSPRGMKTTLGKTRKRLAYQLANPRLLQIHYHTFRHWKATMLYHETKDPHYVQHFLGHKSLRSTEIYINIEHDIFQTGGPDSKWHIKVSEDREEISQLLADGWEVRAKQGENLLYLGKRK